MDNKKIIETLVSLLDDENQQSASFAMAELLNYESELEPVLKKYQESDNLRLRRRIHQIESIITRRNKRKKIAKELREGTTLFFNALVELHTQWYDSDTESSIFAYWNAIVENAGKSQIDSLERLAYFMQKYGFRTAPKGEITAEAFSIGMVLEELTGSAILICAIGNELANTLNFRTEIMLLNEEFCIIDSEKNILLPSHSWQLYKEDQYSPKPQKLSNAQLLEYVTLMLFSTAVASDSYRYVSTIGHILAKAYGSDNLSHLPYPFKSER